MPKIFISYRRGDSAYATNSINSALEQHFGAEAVFFDIDSVGLGNDFREIIAEAVAQCDVLLAVIGNAWLDAKDSEGKRRLDDPADFVRLELEAALNRNIPVVPVLVDEVSIPSAAALPSSMSALAFRNAAQVRAGKDLVQDLERLVKGIDKTVRPQEARQQEARQQKAHQQIAEPIVAQLQVVPQTVSPPNISPAIDNNLHDSGVLTPNRPWLRHLWWVVPLIGLVIAIGVGVVLSREPREVLTAKPVPQGKLSISVSPPGAPVQVVGVPNFRSGMDLPLGKYQIKVPKGEYDGRFYFASQREVEIGTQATAIKMQLEAFSPVMMLIPAGGFEMGSRDGRSSEKPVHRVNIKQAFDLSQTEITFAEYDQFARATQRGLPDDEGWGRENRPVINVSWHDAQAYVDWLSTETGERYRLPSEAEWEYAARAGTTTAYGWGDDITKDDANYGGVEQKTVPVGQYAANAFGLYDMHGNVWEWTADRWHDSYQGAPVDGSVWSEGGDGTQQVLRGGGWLTIPAYLRSADRNRFNTDETGYNVGFRVARPR
ncbi:MAG: SUMF1/EgtB/PvdO family nonheme iron enzyme [Pseudomonadales bacterium]|nr:SUMF1/EgtB/PvdO family nonheme iron enzyme [Pseudomonadales bacterium]